MARTNLTVLTNPPSISGGEDIRPLKPPVEIPSGWEWLWWVAGTALVVTVIVGVVLYLRRRAQVTARTPPPVDPPHVRARRRLEAALRWLSDPKQFCIEVSDTLRWYLEECFRLRAPERTTEEFLNDLSRTTLLTDKQKNSLAEFLQECDLVKFAKFEPPEDALRRLQACALRLVDETAYRPPPLPAQVTVANGQARQNIPSPGPA